jgi:hypothetical protein
MKKILMLTLICSALFSTVLYAQNGDRATLQQMKEKQKNGLVEKAGLTDAQAEKVIEINLELRESMMKGVREMSDEDRAKRITEFKAAKEKKYSEIPLTPQQIKAVYAYYEEMGKNMPQKPKN